MLSVSFNSLSNSLKTLSTSHYSLRYLKTPNTNPLRRSLQILTWNLMGEGLGSLNMKELKQLENRLERGISRIRSKKYEMILAETENLQKREMELEHENALLRAKIAESERLQQLSMVPPAAAADGQEYNAILQAYLARNNVNVLQLNIMEANGGPVSYHPMFPDKKSLHLG